MSLNPLTKASAAATPLAAVSPGGGGSPAARSPRNAPHALRGDHLMTVRHAVAESYRIDGCEDTAVLTEKGEADDWPRMKGGIAAAEAVLRGLFE